MCCSMIKLYFSSSSPVCYYLQYLQILHLNLTITSSTVTPIRLLSSFSSSLNLFGGVLHYITFDSSIFNILSSLSVLSLCPSQPYLHNKVITLHLNLSVGERAEYKYSISSKSPNSHTVHRYLVTQSNERKGRECSTIQCMVQLVNVKKAAFVSCSRTTF